MGQIFMEAAALPWFEWREKCALALCALETQHALTDFAFARFSMYYNQFVSDTNIKKMRGSPVPPRDAWHLFETHFTLSQTRKGKCYKHWLFARLERTVDSTTDALYGGATLIMRDVVRDFLRNECSPSRLLSMQAPIGGASDHTLMLEDLLPGELSDENDPALLELRSLAEAYADEYFPLLTYREKVILLAKELRIPLAHPCLEHATGCRKSAAAQTYRNCLETIADRLYSRYATDDRASVSMLVRLTVEHIREHALEWGKTEKQCAGFFLLTKHDEPFAEIEDISA